jgi:hypothetical protein
MNSKANDERNIVNKISKMCSLLQLSTRRILNHLNDTEITTKLYKTLKNYGTDIPYFDKTSNLRVI